MTAGDAALEIGRGSRGDDLAVVEHGDEVGQLVGLFQVLRGEEDRDALVAYQAADEIPHRAPTSRVKTCGRLVEEDDPRRAHQGHRQVKATLHAAREGEHRLTASVGQLEQREQFRAPLPAPQLGQVPEVRHEQQILLGAQIGVCGRELAGDTDH